MNSAILWIGLVLFCLFLELGVCHFHHYAHKKKKIKHMIIMGHGCHHMVFQEDKKGHLIMMNDHCKHEEHHHHHDDHHHHHDDHHHDDHHHRRRNDLRRSWSKGTNSTGRIIKDLEKFDEPDSGKFQSLKNKITSRKSKRRSSSKNRRSSRRYSDSSSAHRSGKRTLDNAKVSFDKSTNTTHYFWPKKRRTIFRRS